VVEVVAAADFSFVVAASVVVDDAVVASFFDASSHFVVVDALASAVDSSAFEVSSWGSSYAGSSDGARIRRRPSWLACYCPRPSWSQRNTFWGWIWQFGASWVARPPLRLPPHQSCRRSDWYRVLSWPCQPWHWGRPSRP